MNGGQQVPEVQSLAERLDEVESRINGGHIILDRIIPRPESEKEPKATGGIACVNRCLSRMNELNERLEAFAALVGQL